MADCGAGGTALDRVVGSNGASALTAVSLFLEKAASSRTTNPVTNSGNNTLMGSRPILAHAPPETIGLGTSNTIDHRNLPASTPMSNNTTSFVHNQNNNRSIIAPAAPTMNSPSYNHPIAQSPYHHHQQQQSMMYAQAQNQQMQQMQMQMQIQMQQAQMMQFQIMQQQHNQKIMKAKQVEEQQRKQKNDASQFDDNLQEEEQERLEELWEGSTERRSSQLPFQRRGAFVDGDEVEHADSQKREEAREEALQSLLQNFSNLGVHVDPEKLRNEDSIEKVLQNFIDSDNKALYDGVEQELQAELLGRSKQQQQEDDVRSTVEQQDKEVEIGGGGATIEELAEAWANAQNSVDWDEMNDYDADFDPLNIPYEFHQDSYNIPKNLDHFDRGMNFFNEGKIKSAIYSFEAELHKTNSENAQAWYMLGRCYAENDLDSTAISCLERAIDQDPYNLEALLALGVSYVNELDNVNALQNLKNWVHHNPKYAGMEVQQDQAEEGQKGSEIEDVQNLLLQALEWDPLDPDVHEALGVCYNVSKNYDAAVSSFKKALEVRPTDYQLWNKLGATLANSNRSEEALPNYHEAIRLKPRYARAWLNMAISHSNMQNYEEASRCYLQTLSLNSDAYHCWSYLRIAVTCLERWELLPLIAAQDLNKLGEHFDFVQYSS